MEFYLSTDYTPQTLFIAHYNHWYKVVAVFTDDDQANSFMEQNEGTSVLVSEGNAVVIVMKDDKGELSV